MTSMLAKRQTMVIRWYLQAFIPKKHAMYTHCIHIREPLNVLSSYFYLDIPSLHLQLLLILGLMSTDRILLNNYTY